MNMWKSTTFIYADDNNPEYNRRVLFQYQESKQSIWNKLHENCLNINKN